MQTYPSTRAIVSTLREMTPDNHPYADADHLTQEQRDAVAPRITAYAHAVADLVEWSLDATLSPEIARASLMAVSEAFEVSAVADGDHDYYIE